ncbi:MAG: hypothetical protein AAF639_26940 [Chloroflexota bacterium]
MNIWQKQYPNAPLREPSGDWFANRKRELDRLWHWAQRHPNKGSRALTGF